MSKIPPSSIGNQGSVDLSAQFGKNKLFKAAAKSNLSNFAKGLIAQKKDGNENKIPGTSPNPPNPGKLGTSGTRSEIENIDTTFDIQSVMRLMLETSRLFSKAQKEIRKGTFDSHIGALLKSAKEMQKSADFRMYAGMIQGGVQALMGAVQAGISAKAATESSKGIDPQKKASEFNNEAINLDTKANVLSSQAEQLRAEASIAGSPQAPLASIEEPVQTTTSAQDNAKSLNTSEDLATQQAEIAQKNAIATQDEAIAERNTESKAAQTAESIDDLEAKESAQTAESSSIKERDIIKLEIKTETTTAQKIENLENDIKQARLDSATNKLQASEYQKEVDNANATANNWKSNGEIGGKVVDSLNQAGGVYGKHLADDADVEARKHDAEAKRLESQSSEASDAAREANEAKRKILETLESMDRAQLETNRAITHNIN